jgi:hypothetical protein
VGALLGARAVVSQTVGLPAVWTNQATLLSNNIATLSGQVTPNGYQTTYWFEYGTTQALGSITPSQSVGSGYNPSVVSYTLSGLSAGTTYYYRIDAQNQYGIVQGSIVSFYTTGYTGTNGGGVSVTTNAATDVTATGATLNAFAQTGSTQSTAWFEYGTDPAFLSQTTPTTIVATSDFYRQTQTNSFFRYPLTNLTPGTIYYFRAALQNNGVTNYGSTLRFQTSGSPYTYYQQPSMSIPPAQTVYQEQPDTVTAVTPQYVYVPKYIYVNGTPSNNGVSDYSYNQQPVYSYPANYSVSGFMPTQYSYGYAPYAQVTPQGTYYNDNAPLAASVAGTVSNNQASVLVGFILLVSVIVVVGALVFKR